MVRTAAVGFLLALAAHAQGGAPLLQVALHRGRRGAALVAENPYHAAAVEYVVVLNATCEPGCASRFYYAAYLPKFFPDDGDDPTIAPGARATLQRFGPALSLASPRALAVIYADGATAGDPVFLRQMLDQRRINLADARRDLALLQRLWAGPGTDWGAAARRFMTRSARDSRRLEDGPLRRSGPDDYSGDADRLGTLVAGRIRTELAVRGGFSHGAYRSLVGLLRRGIAQLQAAKPPLAALSN